MTADNPTGESRQESGESSATSDQRASGLELPATVPRPTSGWTRTATDTDWRGPIVDPGESQPPTAGTRPTVGTAIGMDVGEVTLATLAPATAVPVPERYERIEYDRTTATTRFERLRARSEDAPADTERPKPTSHSTDGRVSEPATDGRVSEPAIDGRVSEPATGHAARELRSVIRAAARTAIGYVRTFPAPVLVIESLGWRPRPLEWHLRRDGPFRAWLLPAIQTAVIDRARTAGIPVVPAGGHSTVQCHRCCQRVVVRDRTVRCPTESCPVGRVDRDVSAAVTLSRRV